MGANPILAWLAPAVPSFLAAYLIVLVNRGERKREKARAETQAKIDAEVAWREAISKRLTEIEDKLERSISSQVMQIRSDLIHKCHRYLDDLGRASTEEKDALNEQHRQYTKFCKDLDIENDFIDRMVDRVMDLPNREV